MDENLLRLAREAATRLTDGQHLADRAKVDYHHAIRRLHLGGASLREIADALELSHQRVHQIVEASGGSLAWKPRTKPSMECTFCGASKDTVRRLVAGPGVFICDGCVRLSREVITAASPRSHLDQVGPSSGLSCTFCGKSASEVDRLVVGPGVRICDQCVNLCAEIIGE